MSLLTELHGELLTESGLPLLAEYEIESGSGSGSGQTGPVYLKAKATLKLAARAGLSHVKVFTSLPMKAKATLRLISNGLLKSRKGMRAKAALRLIARHGTAQPPSGLGMQMTILADPYRPAVIRDQYLRVWFNGHPNQCKVALKLDDGAEFQPAFTWQNPGITHPAILKIDSAEIPGDGKDHRITVSVWQAVANRTSARATLNEWAKTPLTRPVNQPEWCGVTAIRQGETLYSAPYVISGRVKDLTRIDWRHTGAVQIMAKIPVRTQRADKSWGWKTSVITLGYADHDETTFVAEDLGLLMGWENGALREVWFGVASIHHGQFGPVTWATAPVKLREVLDRPSEKPLTPDEQAGTARVLRLDWLKDEIGKALFAESGWVYPDYWATGTENTRRRDVVNQALDKLLRTIKDRIRRGGSVTLDDLGRFEARWNETRTVRSVGFVASPGFIDGTKAGHPLTDAQAKALTP